MKNKYTKASKNSYKLMNNVISGNYTEANRLIGSMLDKKFEALKQKRMGQLAVSVNKKG